MRRAIILALVACAAPAAAHAAIVIEHPEIRPTIGLQRTTAAYLTSRNTGAGADRLVGAETPGGALKALWIASGGVISGLGPARIDPVVSSSALRQLRRVET